MLAEIESVTHVNINGLVNSIASGNVSIYPNPFSNQLTLDFKTDTEKVTIKIFDALGKYYYDELVLGKSISIRTDGYPSGI